MAKIHTLVWLAILFGLSPLCRGQEPELIVKLQKDRIFEGESVTYQLMLNHVKSPTRPKLEGLDNFLVEDAGEQSQNSSRISIVNGRMTRVERFGMVYGYRLTPRKTGVFTIPAPEIEVDGKILRGRAVTIRVLGPEEQDTVLLEIIPDHGTVYPMQPFSITLKILIKDLPAPYSNQSPLSVQETPPALSLPWVDRVPQGILPESDWRQWLRPIEERGMRGLFSSRGEGFTINRITLFFPTELSTFNPRHRRVMRTDGSGKKSGYWEYTLSRSFISERPGKILFGPVNVKGTFATGLGQNQRLIGESIYAVAESVEILVKNAPEEGRPLTFTGAIGSFTFSAGLVPTQARVGDPLTLTLRLIGKGTLDRTRPPDLTGIPEIANDFKIYEATEETKGSARTFTYSLRPLRAGLAAFPSIALSYFDVEKERYVTLHSDPLPLTIEEAEELGSGDIVTGAAKNGNREKSLEARKEGLFANITDPGVLKNEIVHPTRYATLLGGMVLFYLLAAAAILRVRRVSGDEALKRRRAASGRGRTRLHEGTAGLRSNDIPGGAEKIRNAFAGLVADASDIPEAGLSPRDILERIESLGVEKSLRDRIEELLESLDAARFGAQAAEGTPLAEQSEALFGRLVKELKKKGRLR